MAVYLTTFNKKTHNKIVEDFAPFIRTKPVYISLTWQFARLNFIKEMYKRLPHTSFYLSFCYHTICKTIQFTMTLFISEVHVTSWICICLSQAARKLLSNWVDSLVKQHLCQYILIYYPWRLPHFRTYFFVDKIY